MHFLFDKKQHLDIIVARGADVPLIRAISSEVERFLDTEEVRSSILLSPTIEITGFSPFGLNPIFFELSSSLPHLGKIYREKGDGVKGCLQSVDTFSAP